MKESTGACDPLEYYIQYCKMAEENWAKVAETTVATDSFASVLGKQMEGYVNFLDLFKKSAQSCYENLPIPTDKDINRIAELIIALENKIDAVDDQVALLESKLEKENRALNERIDVIREKLDMVLILLSGISEKPGKSTSKRKKDVKKETA